ncbi:MAG TPA: GGDEF domain-containing protein [Vicinamibacterales bacterium]|nr:GGDEF domain-containing protein [Vicinamibacterales bacterium]
MRDPLIALGLRPRASGPDPSAAAQRLLDVLLEFITEVDPLDTGTLLDRVEMYRLLADASIDPGQLTAMGDACATACRQVQDRISQQRQDQKAEMTALMSLVHQTLGALSGSESGFSSNVGSSMDRIEALSQVDDVRQIKAQLLREVTLIRRLTLHRQQQWEETCLSLRDRVRSLEDRLNETTLAATTDAMTQLTSRGAFESICREWLASPQKQFVLAMLDVDNLKVINDSYGHPAGDRAIVTIAAALKASFRADVDVVARYGGDEFVLLVHGLGFRQTEQRVRLLVSSLQSTPIQTGTGESMRLTISCGMAEYTAGDTLESLVERADSALYAAKRAGRDRIVTKEKPTLRTMLRH